MDSTCKISLIHCVPSIDSQVCSTETKKWEKQRSDMGDLEMLTVSMDLPLTQQRWCAANNVEHKTLSAHRSEQFGVNYGVLIKELRLLDRAVFVVDKDDKIRYVEYVEDIADEPDYDRAIQAAREAAR